MEQKAIYKKSAIKNLLLIDFSTIFENSKAARPESYKLEEQETKNSQNKKTEFSPFMFGSWQISFKLLVSTNFHLLLSQSLGPHSSL